MRSKQAAVVVILVGTAFIVGRYSRHHQASTAAAPTRHILYYVDPMHPSYRSSKPGTAPDCGMQLEPVYAQDAVTALQSTDDAAIPAGSVGVDGAMQQALGIRLASVEKSGAPQVVRLLGRVVAEDTRVYRIDSGTEGFIRETFNDSVGTLVKKNQKLASCYGPEYLSVASGYLAAVAGVPGANGKDGSRTMPHPGALSKQGVSSIQGYSDRLRNLGMSEAQISEMDEKRQLPETVDIVSPTSGFVIARNITPGQHFDRSMEFYRIADLSRVWILADVFEDEAHKVHSGAIARVSLREQGKSFTARVIDVLPQVDPATRTLKLRLEVDNPSFILRPDMFADVELTSSLPAGLTVPADAVVDSGLEQRVFVQRADGAFEARKVQTGWHAGDRVQIISGLAEGERVVAEGTFLVDSETRLKLSSTPADQQHHDHTPQRTNPEPAAAMTAASMSCSMATNDSGSMETGSSAAHAGNHAGGGNCKPNMSPPPEHYLASTH